MTLDAVTIDVLNERQLNVQAPVSFGLQFSSVPICYIPYQRDAVVYIDSIYNGLPFYNRNHALFLSRIRIELLNMIVKSNMDSDIFSMIPGVELQRDANRYRVRELRTGIWAIGQRHTTHKVYREGKALVRNCADRAIADRIASDNREIEKEGGSLPENVIRLSDYKLYYYLSRFF